jgi:type IV pilus assembly protein PilY1
LIGYGPEGEELHGYEIKPANFPNGGYTQAIQNFANWFSYYRKRSLLTRAAMGRAFEDLDFLRVGAFEINDRNQVDMIDFDDPAARKAFFDSQYELRADGGTPNRQSVKHIGDQFANRTGNDAPIVEACQRNFGLLVTDGFSNDWNGAGVGNTDGPSTPDGEPDAFGAILSDSQSNTIADIAYNYYNTRLRTDLEAGLVTVPAACSQPNPSLALDCNKDLHMNLFAITLGAEGIVFGKDQTMTEDPFTNPPEWPTNFKNRSPTAVDDLWHATLNTRGEMFSAKRPSELVRSLSEVLSQIASRVEPVGITVSSARIDESSIFFVADLDSTTWSGNLTAFRFNEETDPEFDDPEVVWQATDPGNIAAADDRTIMTVVNGSVIPFRSGNNALNARVFGPDSTLTSAEKAQIIDYLRGDQSNELSTDGTTGEFRRRDTRLGDIANSRPVFAGPRNEGWARLDASYIDFLDSKDKELTPSYSPLALVGANDGMVHVFNADTGREVFAFIPSVLHSKLPQLSDPTYTHKLFVDGQIRVADAKISESGAVNGWNTVAVGALAGGGKGIYALNITNESSPEVLWELTDADDSDIGHVYDTPIVTRLSNGEWVVIFANGVNSGDEEPVLFVVNLKNGTIIDKVELGGNQDSPGNGLMSTAALMDPAERTSLARIYAGDLQGKMWRVDFTPSAEAQFNNSPLVDVERPLMAPPTLAPHPGGGVMVFFGTGKLIELSDRTNSGDIETFWAVRDRGSKISNARNLAEATINDTSEGRTITVGGEDVIDGWYLDLTSSSSGTGEKVLSRPRVVFGQAIFSTFEPLEDPCASGGFNRVYIVDAVGGVGRFDAKCQNCGVAELGEGAPVDPAIVIRQPTRPVLGNPSDSDGDGSPDIPSGPTGSDVGNTNEWCSVLNLLLPQDGLVEIGRICDGRQVWRRVPIEQ